MVRERKRKKGSKKSTARRTLYTVVALSIVIWALFLSNVTISLGTYDYDICVEPDHYRLVLTLWNVTFINREYPTLKTGDNVTLGFKVGNKTYWVTETRFIPGFRAVIDKTITIEPFNSSTITHVYFIDGFLKIPTPFNKLWYINKTRHLVAIEYWYGSLCTGVNATAQLLMVNPSVKIVNNGDYKLFVKLYVIKAGGEAQVKEYIIEPHSSDVYQLELNDVANIKYLVRVVTGNPLYTLVLEDKNIVLPLRKNLTLAVVLQILIIAVASFIHLRLSRR